MQKQSGLFLVAALSVLLPRNDARAQASPFDGAYRAAPGGVTSSGPRCEATTLVPPLKVKEGVATMQTARFGTFEGKVAPDGSLAILLGRYTLSGKFSEGHFVGGWGFPNCNISLHMDRG